MIDKLLKDIKGLFKVQDKVKFLKQNIMFGCPIFVAFAFLYLCIGVHVNNIADAFFDVGSLDKLSFCNFCNSHYYSPSVSDVLFRSSE